MTPTIVGFILGCVAIVALPLILPKLLRPRERVPGWDTRMRACPYPSDVVARALATFDEAWKARWPDQSARVRYGLNRTNIYWYDEVFFIAVDGRTKAVGEAPKRSTVKVAYKDREFYQTAIFHELVHTSLMWLRLSSSDKEISEAHHQLVKECKEKMRNDHI